MHEWTMTHPYLTFTLVFTGILMVNNIVMGLIRPVEKKESHNVQPRDVSLVKNEDFKKVDKETDTDYN